MNRPLRDSRPNPLPLARARRPGAPASPGPPLVPLIKPALADSVVDWALYHDGVRQPARDLADAVASARGGDGFVWIGLHDPGTEQLEQLGEVFGLHPLAVEDAANRWQRPKIERFDDIVFLAMRALAYVAHTEPDGRADDGSGDVVETGAVMVFLGEYFVATVRHGRHAAMSELRRRLESDPEHLALGPSVVLHAIADKVVDDYLVVTDDVQQDIEEIENAVFAPRASTAIERLYQLKRDVIEMKRTVNALAGPMHELAERPRKLVPPEVKEYFRDVEDHLSRVREQVASFDELLTSILQAALARLSVAENEDMRRISAWVAIAAVPTMIAGIYGMNFDHMPELGTRWGYPLLMLVMLTICSTLYRGFRRNGWL
jgi:magnesium transporter